MEYYWELRNKNAQNIKALMCPLYKNSPFEKETWIGSRELTRKAKSNNKRLNDGAVGSNDCFLHFLHQAAKV